MTQGIRSPAHASLNTRRKTAVDQSHAVVTAEAVQVSFASFVVGIVILIVEFGIYRNFHVAGRPKVARLNQPKRVKRVAGCLAYDCFCDKSHGEDGSERFGERFSHTV